MKRLQVIWQIFVLTILSLTTGGYFAMKALPQFGAVSKGERKERMKKVSNYKNGKFWNLEYTPVQSEDFSAWKTMKEFMRNDSTRIPHKPVRSKPIDASNILVDSSMHFIWLGHSSMLMIYKGKSYLFDPVFSGHASPFAFTGPKEFLYTEPISIKSIPKIDVVIISHDHYDHLDYKTIVALRNDVKEFIVPLGVGAHLIRWGVDASKIREHAWWESSFVNNLDFICAPARHFSGRGIADRNKTLWCSWIIKSDSERVFFSGDSGYGTHFKEIGDRFGPFDFAFMECGQYNESWPYIHMMPEETVKASFDIKAQKVVPIHWGKFKLSLHSWTEPVERLVIQSKADSMHYIVPKIGEIISEETVGGERWWEM